MKISTLLVLALVGCSDELQIADGTCGNGVLDPGEDCDRPGIACTASCRFACDFTMQATCTGAVDGTCCPAAFSCGVDNVCRQPSGTVSSSDIAAPFAVLDFRVADLDGDGFADVLGVSTAAVIARYGAATTPLAISEVRTAPFAAGEIAIGDYTGDGRPDILIPASGGFSGFETTTGVPEPVAFPHDVAPLDTLIHSMVAADPLRRGLLRLDFVIADNSIELSLDGVSPKQPCGIQYGFSHMRGRSISPYLDGARTLVPMIIATNGGAAICIADPTGPSSSHLLPGTQVPADTEVFFARFTAGPCPELVYGMTDATGDHTVIVPGIGVAGSCGVDWTPGKSIVLDNVLPLAPVLLADGAPGLVTSFAVVAITFAPPYAVIENYATRPWTYAVTADFNRDGREDFAVAGLADDIEIFEQLPFNGTAQWKQQRIPTLGVVGLLAVGDYDGDGTPDLAFPIIDLSNARMSTIEVSYGGDPFTAPATVTTVREYFHLAEASLGDPSLPPGVGHADDLVVAHGGDDPTTETAKLTYLYGSGSRVMSAPWIYEADRSGLAATIGNYGPNNTPGAVVSIYDQPWWPGSPRSALALQVTRDPDTLAVASSTPLSGFAARDLANGRYATVPLPEGELLLGLRSDGDTTRPCATYYVAKPGSLALSLEPCATLLPVNVTGAAQSAATRAKTLHVLAGQANGANLLMISDTANGGPSAMYQWTVSLVGGAPVLASPVDLTAELDQALGITDAECLDATEAELGTRTVKGVTYGGGRELVLACKHAKSTQLYARYAADAGGAPIYEHLLDIGGRDFVIVHAGDVDGDGLDDVIYAADLGDVHVARQCDALTPCAGGN